MQKPIVAGAVSLGGAAIVSGQAVQTLLALSLWNPYSVDMHGQVRHF